MPPTDSPARPAAHLLRVLLAAAVAALAGGCVHRVPNPPLEAADLDKGYYFHNRVRPDNSADTLFILCFSGGGTRAAALSYGVLEELRDTVVQRGSLTHRLLDEVDGISSVSGGSFTAGAYALYGDKVFDVLEHSFLKRNVQTELLWRTLNPARWPKLMSKTYGRSELAADLYDEVLFRGAVFRDLIERPGGFVVINATDVSSGARFGFTQYQFDLLCSDLSEFKLSHAVAASSAVPGLLSPVTVNNYAGRCGSELARDVAASLGNEATNVSSRARFHFLEMASYLDSTNHPYIHLVDGGVSDNLGVRAVLDGIFAIESRSKPSPRADLSKVRRVAIVVVNAFSKPDTGWSRHEVAPGTLALAVAGATIPMDRYSYETIELLKEQVERWRTRLRPADAAQPAVEFYPVIVSFSALTDPKEREFFLNQPTSFFLKDEAVDRLREVGGRLLRQSTVFQDFVKDLASTPAAPGPDSRQASAP